MKVAPLNRWQYSRNLEIGINAFGLIFCPVEFLEIIQKRKKRNGAVPLGQRGHSSSRPRGGKPSPRGRHIEGVKAEYAFSRRRIGARARARFKPDGWIPPVRACG